MGRGFALLGGCFRSAGPLLTDGSKLFVNSMHSFLLYLHSLMEFLKVKIQAVNTLELSTTHSGDAAFLIASSEWDHKTFDEPSGCYLWREMLEVGSQQRTQFLS